MSTVIGARASKSYLPIFIKTDVGLFLCLFIHLHAAFCEVILIFPRRFISSKNSIFI